MAAVLTPPRLRNGHEDSVNALALDQTAVLLASGGDDACLCIWAPKERRLLHRVCHSTDEPVTALRFSEARPERLFAAHGADLLVWDVRALSEPAQCLSLAPALDGPAELNWLALHPTEPRLLAADDAGRVHVLDADSGACLASLPLHDNVCATALFRPSTAQLLSGGLDCRLVAADWSAGCCVQQFDMADLAEPEALAADALLGGSLNPPMVHCLAGGATPDGGWLMAAGLENGSVELFTAASPEAPFEYAESLCGHARAVGALLRVPVLGTTDFLVSGGADAQILVWPLEGGDGPRRFTHHAKINQLEGRLLEEVFVADVTASISVCDLSAA